ncbi:MAG: tetratricopeptide repeat protein, partial [Phycisphaerae bacterium]
QDVGICALPHHFRTPSAWRYIVPAGLVVLTVMVFMSALDAGLVFWDDDDLLISNTRYQIINGDNLKWMFTTSYAGHFQPLTWLTYAMDFAIWGADPLGFHLTSVLFHVMTAVSFYFLTRSLLAEAMGSPELARSKPLVLSAGCAAALFALHPLRAESVAWIAERRDVVSGLFYVLAVACYIRYAASYATGSADRAGTQQEESLDGAAFALTAARRKRVANRWVWYAGVLLLCLLSLLAKATAITMPFVLLILDAYPLRRTSGGAKWWRAFSRRVWMEKLPLFAMAGAAGIRALIAQSEGGSLASYEDYGLLPRLAQACYGLVFYLVKTLWPVNLSPLYEIPAHASQLGWQLWGSLVAVVGLAWMAFVWRRRFPAIAAALAVYAVVLAPVLGLAQSGPQLVADRYSYLSCMGLAVVVGSALLRSFRGDSWWAVGHRRAALGLCMAGLIAVLQQATFHQADIWRSPLRLWGWSVRVSPNSAIAHVNYADALAVADVIDGAIYHYRCGLALNPEDAVALHHLGDALCRIGEYRAASFRYMRALQIDPTRRRACYSLARILVGLGRATDAVAVLRDGIRRNPDEWEMVEYLALLLSCHPDADIRSTAEAVSLASRASLGQGANDPHALLTLATALAGDNRFNEAVTTAQRALVVARKEGKHSLASSISKRLAMFRAQQPYRLGPQGVGTQSPTSPNVDTTVQTPSP